METTVKQRLEQFLESKNISKSEFGRLIGVSSAYISSMRKSIQPDKLESIALKFPELNIEWLLNGTGLMLKEKEELYSSAKGLALPLIPIPAICGYTEDNWSVLAKDCPLYSVPDTPSADFLIRTSGDSMQPKYNEGDLLACRMINEVLFFQWGKTYVLDTSQGVMVKNIYEDKDNPKNVLLVSENAEKYPPFVIPRSDIRKLALVVGSLRIRMEL
jgi:transcriptional regulator with XRE-family HTH domain